MLGLEKYRVGALCAGYGGIELGLSNVLETELLWYSEIDKSAAKIMKANFPGIPNLGDLTQIRRDSEDFREVDIVTAGFPCQPVSLAAEVSRDKDKKHTYRKGFRDVRWLIRDVCEIAAESGAKWLILENVPGLLSWKKQMAFDKVREALRANGYRRMEWGMYRASDVGAPHQRRRWFCVASTTRSGKLVLKQNEMFLYQEEGVENCLKGEYPYFGFADFDKRVNKNRTVDLPQKPQQLRTLPTPTAREHKDSGPCIRFERISYKSGLTGVIMYKLCKDRKFQGWKAWRTNIRKPVIKGKDQLEAAIKEYETNRDSRELDLLTHIDAEATKLGLSNLCTDEMVELLSGNSMKGEGRNNHRTYFLKDPGPNEKEPLPDFTPAIKKWERIRKRKAPNPLLHGEYGLLNPEFVEWMMGLPKGHVTSKRIGLAPTVALRILGNGVVPLQAELAITSLVRRMNRRFDDRPKDEKDYLKHKDMSHKQS